MYIPSVIASKSSGKLPSTLYKICLSGQELQCVKFLDKIFVMHALTTAAISQKRLIFFVFIKFLDKIFVMHALTTAAISQKQKKIVWNFFFKYSFSFSWIKRKTTKTKKMNECKNKKEK